MPHLQEVADTYKDKNVRVVGLSVDAQTAPVKKFFKGVDGLDYDLAHVGDGAMKELDISGIPSLFIVGSDGTVLRYIRGYTPGDNRLEQALDYFLEGGTIADAEEGKGPG